MDWVGRELIVVDYKATSSDKEITLDDKWKQAYKRQMEFYQWLLRCNGFGVADRGCFVYVNGSKDREAFDGRLEFEVQLIPYEGSDDWVEETVNYAHDCLMDSVMPDAAEECEWCNYRESVQSVLSQS